MCVRQTLSFLQKFPFFSLSGLNGPTPRSAVALAIMKKQTLDILGGKLGTSAEESTIIAQYAIIGKIICKVGCKHVHLCLIFETIVASQFWID